METQAEKEAIARKGCDSAAHRLAPACAVHLLQKDFSVSSSACTAKSPVTTQLPRGPLQSKRREHIQRGVAGARTNSTRPGVEEAGGPTCLDGACKGQHIAQRAQEAGGCDPDEATHLSRMSRSLPSSTFLSTAIVLRNCSSVML